MSTWRWVGERVVLAMHDAQLAQFGGLDGVRDLNALRSALARPEQLAVYGDPPPDAAALAAAYAYGLARSHAFSDANKRTAWAVARVFLLDNGHQLRFVMTDMVETMVQLAQDAMSQDQFADWLRQRLV